MKTKWLDRDDLDGREMAGAAAIMEACRAQDHPELPVRTVRGWTNLIRYGWDGEPGELLVGYDKQGRVAAAADVWLPRRDNTHLVFASIYVDPALRRRGFGRAMFDEVVEHARKDDRTAMITDSADRPEYAAFAEAMGLERVHDEVLRRQDLMTIDWARLDAEFAAALPRAANYELIRIAGPTPPELLGPIATLTAAINDAPHTSETAMEPEIFTPERIREFDAAQEKSGRRVYRVVASHRGTGELGGHTVVAIDEEQPWHASQYDTSVLDSHRGNRLGLLLKVDMLRWLADEEPQARELTTGNAASNQHMIKVNDLLGYVVFDLYVAWQRDI